MDPSNQGIGQWLVDEQFITLRQLEKALSQARQSGESLPKVLVWLGFVSEIEILEVKARKLGTPCVDLDSVTIDPESARLLPEQVARRYQALPIGQEGENLTVAMVEPGNLFAVHDIRLFTDLNLEPVIVTESAMARALTRVFGGQNASEGQVIADEVMADDQACSLDTLKALIDEAPIVRGVNLILSQAINDQATAIHIEKGVVRYRVDGVLYEVMNPPENVHLPMVARIKIMAHMDIAENRIPQDGKIELLHNNSNYDLRVSTLPCEGGEKVILKVFTREPALQPEIGNLGLSSQNRANLEMLLKRGSGLLWVSGPGGSGRATTLFSCLRTVSHPEKCAYSFTDPYHFRMNLPWVNEISLNRKLGLTLESALASCLRSDPDVLLIGSFGSAWEARLAVDAALRGHLVLAPTYGGNAAQGLVNLINTGIEPYLLSQALLGILNQRLARRLCPDCRKSVPAPPGLNQEFISIGQGCKNCRSSGYRGRIGLQELLPNSEPISALLLTSPSSTDLHELACRQGMVPMREDAFEKVRQSVISYDEMLRTLQD